jgi:hypothetical protein
MGGPWDEFKFGFFWSNVTANLREVQIWSMDFMKTDRDTKEHITENKSHWLLHRLRETILESVKCEK